MHRLAPRRLVAAILVAVAIWSYLATGQMGERQVVAAARELEAGHRLSAEDLTMRKVKSVPSDALERIDAADGRVLRIALLAGEPVIGRKLAEPGIDSMSALIPPGMMAVAFTPESRVVIHKGDVVLISATLDGSRIETRGNPYRVVAERARVIAVKERLLTVLLTPQERTFLATGAAYGTLDAAVVDASG